MLRRHELNCASSQGDVNKTFRTLPNLFLSYKLRVQFYHFYNLP